MWASKLALSVSLTLLLCATAGADSIVLKNGVELRDVVIVDETQYTVTVQIIEYTKATLGKSKISKIERTGTGQVWTAPRTEAAPALPVDVPAALERVAAAVPKPVPSPPQIAPPAAPPGMIRQVLRFPAVDPPGKELRLVLEISPSTGIEAKPELPKGLAPPASLTYTIQDEQGKPLKVTVSWAADGSVENYEIVPPLPPPGTEIAETEHVIKTASNEAFKIIAKWDLTRDSVKPIEWNVLPLSLPGF